jgi:hypothetical protein
MDISKALNTLERHFPNDFDIRFRVNNRTHTITVMVISIQGNALSESFTFTQEFIENIESPDDWLESRVAVCAYKIIEELKLREQLCVNITLKTLKPELLRLLKI